MADENNETLDTQDVVELLGEEEPQETLDISTPVKVKSTTDDDKGDEGEEEEVDELKEIEEELEGPKDEDLELITPVRRKEILAKFPTLFKDFPYLEKAYYRDQQFTELYPSIQDAKQAAEKSQILDGFENLIIKGGDIGIVLQAAKEESQEAFFRIADNYLPALKKVDQQAYYHVLGNVLKDTIITMVREGRALGEQGTPLTSAANILNQFIFGSSNFQPPTTLSRQVDPQQQGQLNEVQQQRQQLFNQQFTQVRDELQTKADNVLKATIDGNIDPHKSMTDYVRKNASREALESIEGLLAKDTRFRGLLDRLWEKAYQTNFDKTSTDRIKSAYLSKARTLLPSVIKKARNDALRGLGRRASGDLEPEIETERTTRKSPTTSGKSTSNNSGRIRSSKDIPAGMSTLDFLMKD
jgi:hypothetical protein